MNQSSTWKNIPLKEVITLISGRDLPKDDYNSSRKGIPYIMGASNMSEGKLEIERWTDKPTVLGNRDDIIISVKGTIGELLILEEEVVHLSRQVMAIRTNDNVYNKFIFYFLKFYLERLKFKAKGLIPGITREDILNEKISLPPLEEQKKIGAVLDKAQSLIKKQKQTMVIIDEFVQAVFLKLFKGFISNVNLYQSLEEISDFIDYRGKTPERSKQGIRLITARNVGQGIFRNEIKDYITEELYQKIMTRGFPKEKDILFVTEGHTLGFLTRIPKGFKKFAVGQRLISIRCNQKVTPEFLESYMLLENFQKEIIKKTTGSSAKGIRSAQLKKITVPIPPYEIQEIYTKIIENIDDQKLKQKIKLHELEKLFNALLQRAFKGELIIKEEITIK